MLEAKTASVVRARVNCLAWLGTWALLWAALAGGGPAWGELPKPSAAAGGAPAATFTEGQKVEAREGDTWSPATIVKREGRKFLIHYEGADAGSDEWVTSDRLRVPGAGGAAAPAAPAPAVKPAAPGAASAPAAAPRPQGLLFDIQDQIEVKWGGLWFKATVLNKRNNKWYLVKYDRDSFREWVEPWRVRKIGSTEDLIGHAQPNRMIHMGPVGDPPREDPGPPPAPFGSSAHAGGLLAARAAKEAAAEKELEQKAPLTPVDRAGVRDVVFGGGGDAVVDDPEPKAARTTAQPVVLAGLNSDASDPIQTLYFSAPDAAVAAIVYGSMSSHDNHGVRVERVDLASSKSLGISTISVPVKACDLSADGKLLLAHSVAFGFGKSDRLDVWNVETAQAKHVVSFKPYDDQQHSYRDVNWAKFVGADKVLTFNHDGQLVLWDLKGKALWAAQVDGQCTPAISGGGKQLAVAVGQTIAIAEVQTGKTLRILSASQSLSGTTLSFKPDGRQIGAAASNMLVIWDLASGDVAHDVSPVGSSGHSIVWVDDDFVLLDDQYLVGLEQKTTVWRYEREIRSVEHSAGLFGGRFWYVVTSAAGKGTRGVLTSAVLPEPAVKKRIAQLPAENLMVIQPGMSVSLEVSLPDNIEQKVIDALKARLTANGLKVEDGRPIKLVATTEQGQSREIRYQNMMGPRIGPFAQAGETMSVNDQISRLTFVGEGDVKLWERKNVRGAPPFVQTKQGQSAQDAVNEYMAPSAMFFTQARIPKYVPKPMNPPGYGASDLTAQGVVRKN